MKINIHAGHAPAGKKGSGAVGIVQESIIDREIKNAVIAKLRALGHTVYDCTCENGGTATAILKNICSKANAHKVDIDVSIHLNAGGGQGTEVLVYKTGGTAEKYAKQVLSQICALGYRNRGVKVRTDLYYLKHTSNTSMLIETMFCDSQEDVNRYNVDKMANAIVKGLTGQVSTVTESKPSVSAPTTPKKYLAKGDKGDAVKAMQKMLIACGYSCGNSGADGDFGSGTDTALRNFQKANGLTVDGKYGSNSKAKLEALYKSKTQTTTSTLKNSVIATGQQHSINFTGSKIAVDGIYGTNTKKNGIRCVQRAINLDYKKSLSVDGIWGSRSEQALGTHYIKKGETQYLVTAVEILLMLRGYNPNGVECPGKFGSGLEACVKQFQKANGLTADGIAGAKTIKKLMGV